MRILWISEAPYLNTGYAVYTKNVLSYLSSLPDFEIIQLGVYAEEGDNRNYNYPWRIIPNQPNTNVPEYKSSEINAFGAWKFDEICSQFKPDVVCNIGDLWMFEFILRSPYAKYFNTVIMPTCDSEPQPRQWVEIYSKIDKVLAYNDWSRKELEYRGLTNVVGTAPPVADSKFYPYDHMKRLRVRSQMGFGNEVIFGTVMRNQARKLFPQLFNAFREFLNYGKAKLICHTSFPDKGWDIPQLLKRYNLSSQVLFTYKCSKCEAFSLDSFKSCIKECPRCRHVSSKLCNVESGIDTDQLCSIYNLMDLYLQPCTNEGFGMPLCEAAACGVPIAATNYSAPEDILNKLNGYKLDYVRSCNVTDNIDKAVVSVESITNVMREIYNTPKEVLNKKRLETRRLFESEYGTWEKTSRVWENVIGQAGRGRWDAPLDIQSSERPQNITSAYDMSKFLIENTLKENKLYTLMHARLIRDLSLGFVKKTMGGEYEHEYVGCQMAHDKITAEEFANVFENRRLLINEAERRRSS